MPFGFIGPVVSTVIYGIMMVNLGVRYFALSCIITAVCLLFYFLYSRNHALSSEELKTIRDAEAYTLEEDHPTDEERAGMDREVQGLAGDDRSIVSYYNRRICPFHSCCKCVLNKRGVQQNRLNKKSPCSCIAYHISLTQGLFLLALNCKKDRAPVSQLY